MLFIWYQVYMAIWRRLTKIILYIKRNGISIVNILILQLLFIIKIIQSHVYGVNMFFRKSANCRPLSIYSLKISSSDIIRSLKIPT